MIVRKLIRNCRKAGYVARLVYDGGAYVKVRTERDVLTAVDSVDDSTIHFEPVTGDDGHSRGVYVVLGNGVDCLSDWHCGDKAFDAAVETVCDYVNTLEQ